MDLNKSVQINSDYTDLGKQNGEMEREYEDK
jgi:hypothetical protein